MRGQTVILHDRSQIDVAHRLIDAAPRMATVNVRPQTRSVHQNARMWAMLSEVSRQADHFGKKYTPETWKCIFMNAMGHSIKFVPGLEGEPFPIGFKSSRLSKSQMVDLQTYIEMYAANNGLILADGDGS